MKIKTDFVTNSSSTGYIVFVPEIFTITAEMLKEHQLYDELSETSDDELTGIANQANQCLSDLVDGGSVDNYELGSTYWLLIRILEKKDLVIAVFDVSGSDGSDFIGGLKKEAITDIFMEHIANLKDTASIMSIAGEEAKT